LSTASPWTTAWAAKAALAAALREAQCGARAAPRRFRRTSPKQGDLHRHNPRGVFLSEKKIRHKESRREALPTAQILKNTGKTQKTFDIYSPI